MKTNIITVAFNQLIPARIPMVTNEAGVKVPGKEIPARVVNVEFKEETDKEVNAKNLAQYFFTRLFSWQELRPLQGKEGFQTSKSMSVSINVNRKELNTEMKFTINPERVEKCLQNVTNLMLKLTRAMSAPEFDAPDGKIVRFITMAPENVIFAKKIDAEPKPRRRAPKLSNTVVTSPLVEELIPA